MAAKTISSAVRRQSDLDPLFFDMPIILLPLKPQRGSAQVARKPLPPIEIAILRITLEEESWAYEKEGVKINEKP